jgi:gliding motility-associated-like protein
MVVQVVELKYSTPFSTDPHPTVTPPAPPPSYTDDNTTITTRYILTVTSPANCVATASIDIEEVQAIVIPDIFSPNGDQYNQTWDIKHLAAEYPNNQVTIFNRYGQFIFRSPDHYITQWNGTYEGHPLPVGTYFYIIKTTPDAKPISGPISIVR